MDAGTQRLWGLISNWGAIRETTGPLEPAFEAVDAELDKLLSEAYAEGRADQLEESKEKT